MTRFLPLQIIATLVLGLAGADARADRHGVEPAPMLGRGDCESEFTLDRLQGGVGMAELELACRVGPVQLGGQAEYRRDRPDSATSWSAELKWSRTLGDWHLGVFLQNEWEAHQRPRHTGTAVTGLASYGLREDLQLHLNLGREFAHRGEDSARAGIGVEWTIIPRWTVLGERFVRDETHFARASVRWAAGHNWTLELARAQRLAGPEPSRWILGINVDLDDD
jgi:hypothetical protein